MLLTKTVKVKWHGGTKKHYIDRGYKFTKIGDEFEVRVEDLPTSSQIIVDVSCDECGLKYKVRYATLSKSKYGINLCKKCIAKRVLNKNRKLSYEQLVDKFNKIGCTLLTKKDEFKNTKQMLKYICPNGHYNEGLYTNIMRQKGICKLCLTTPIEEIREEFSRRGYILLSQSYTGKKQKLKYICKCGSYAEVFWSQFKLYKKMGCMKCVNDRRIKTMCENGVINTSFNQKYLHYILGGMLNYPVKMYSLDIAFPEEKIYIEYDGSGHGLSAKLGARSEEEQKRIEIIRDKMLQEEGWKRIRIISKYDKLPNREETEKLINFCFAYLKHEGSWVHIDIDNNEIYSRRFSIEVSFNNLLTAYSIKKKYKKLINQAI